MMTKNLDCIIFTNSWSTNDFRVKRELQKTHCTQNLWKGDWRGRTKGPVPAKNLQTYQKQRPKVRKRTSQIKKRTSRQLRKRTSQMTQVSALDNQHGRQALNFKIHCPRVSSDAYQTGYPTWYIERTLFFEVQRYFLTHGNQFPSYILYCMM